MVSGSVVATKTETQRANPVSILDFMAITSTWEETDSKEIEKQYIGYLNVKYDARGDLTEESMRCCCTGMEGCSFECNGLI